jgi:LPXTG-site transpeptidase (sortase) family protein
MPEDRAAMTPDHRGDVSPHRWRLGLGVAGAVVLLVIVGFFVAGPGTVGGVTIAREPTVAGGSSSDAAPAPTRPPQADSIKDLVAQYGEPPDATFARLVIPKLGIDAGVSPRVVTGAVMPTPDGPENIAWYDMSAFPGLGGVPGAGKNAIFGGHVDFNNHVQYSDTHFTGPAIFYSLDHLVPGDTIEIDYQGETLTYQVSWVEQLDAATADWSSIWSNNVEADSITLFTCGGTFDRDAHAYSHRFVVRAERV